MSVTRTRSKAVGAAAIALLLAFAGTAQAQAPRGLKMSGTWVERFGSIFIPQGSVFPFIPEQVDADAVARVQNPDSAGPATVTLSRSAFSRPVIPRNGAIPVPQFVQLFSSFSFHGPQTLNNTSVTSPYAAIIRPTLTRANPSFNYCPGATVNPACATHKTVGQGAGPSQGTMHGIIRYTAAATPFGGTLRMLIAGSGALTGVLAGAKGTPNAQFSHAPIGGGGAAQAQVVGGAYDGRNTLVLGAGVVTTGAVLAGTVNNLKIVAPGNVIGVGAAVTNTNVGMPFTVGKVSVQATVINGAVTMYTAQGYDARTPGGVGNLQLVAAGITRGLLTGNVYQRVDEMTMAFSEGSATPAVSPTGIVALGSLLVLGGGYVLRRRLS